MVNPLDLFSEDAPQRHADSQGIRPSSPVQETDTLKELKLIELQKELLEKRNALKAEIQKLENDWNEMRSNVEIEDNQNEDDAIFELLIQRANEDEGLKGDTNTEKPTEQSEHTGYSSSKDLDEFSAKPSKNWEDRIEYLKRFYKDVKILQHSSKVSLEYNDPVNPMRAKFIKTISFTVRYPKNVIRLDTQVKLIKIENSYQVYDLILTKKSNNKLNTILLDITDHFAKTKNINELLFTLNMLYTNIITRHRILTKTKESYNQQPPTLFSNQFNYLDISFIWDLVFRDGEIIGLVNVNGSYNDVFIDLVDRYGVENAIETLIRHVYPADDPQA